MTKKGKKKFSKKSSRYYACLELKGDLPPSYNDIKKILKIQARQRRDEDSDLTTVLVPFETLIGTDGSGNVQLSYQNNPNDSDFWIEYQQNYDQYRVLGMRVEFEPVRHMGGSVVTIKAPMVIVTDYDDGIALTAYSLAETFSDCQKHKPETPFTKISVDPDINNAGFNNQMSAAPTNPFWVKIYSAGNTESIALGRLTITYVVQLRGRGI